MQQFLLGILASYLTIDSVLTTKEYFFNSKIKSSLLEKVSFETPAEFLKNWLFISNEEKFSLEQIEKEYPLYEKDLKWQLISGKIAKDNEIKTEHDDVLAAAKKILSNQFLQYGTVLPEEQMAEFADNYLKGNEGKNYQEAYRQAEADKILSLIKDKIKIDDKEVTLDEFRELPLN